MRLRLFVPTACVLLATIAYAQKVTFDSNPSAPFASYKTYAWTQGTPVPDSLMEQRIHDGVAAQLAAKGLMPTDATPDLFVATHAVTQDHPQLVFNGFGWGLGGTASVENYCSWGFFDFRKGDDPPEQGYQSVPVDWGINSPRKKAFFAKLKEITGGL